MYCKYFQPSLIFVVKAKAHLDLLLFELQQTELKTRDTEGRSSLFVKKCKLHKNSFITMDIDFEHKSLSGHKMKLYLTVLVSDS